MRRRFSVFLVVLAALAACTKPNPRSCADGTCTDPAFPFCDVDGTVEGAPNTCISGECTPSTFAGCRGDLAITCNADGTNYDTARCELGCADDAGCRLCAPNETACTNGTAATCDANGTVVSQQACPLGCFENEPRCRDIVPSNDLAQFLDMADTAPDLTLASGGTIDTQTGNVVDAGNHTIAIPSVLVPAPAGGAAIRVFIANHVRFGGKVAVTFTGADGSVSGPALAIVANSDIEISGELTFWLQDQLQVIGAAGGVDIVGCSGKAGQVAFLTNPSQQLAGGSSGGGHATAGGDGGSVRDLGPVRGGTAMGDQTLVPLRGGCAGGGPGGGAGGGFGGGGAVQLSSRTFIKLDDGATINVDGLNGDAPDPGFEAIFGPGAGGGILLEAPSISFGSDARLLANGGVATALGGPVQPSLTTQPAIGGICAPTSSSRCSNSGNGGASDVPAATAGGDVVYTTSASVTTFLAGAGGGGLGYIRINTADASFGEASNTIKSGSISAGVLTTR